MIFPASVLAFVAFVAAQAPADPSITTPAAVVQCQPVLINWTASKGPAFISIIPGGQASAAPLQDFGSQTGNSLTWVANIPAGTQITFQVKDAAGVPAYSAPVTIQPSSDSSCIGQSQPSVTSGTVSQTGTATGVASSVSASVSSAASSAASSISSSVLSSIEASTSSVVASASSVIASATSTRPASSSSTRPAASATSATPSPSASANAARSNAQVGFAGLLGLVAAAAVMA